MTSKWWPYVYSHRETKHIAIIILADCHLRHPYYNYTSKWHIILYLTEYVFNMIILQYIKHIRCSVTVILIWIVWNNFYFMWYNIRPWSMTFCCGSTVWNHWYRLALCQSRGMVLMYVSFSCCWWPVTGQQIRCIYLQILHMNCSNESTWYHHENSWARILRQIQLPYRYQIFLVWLSW